MQKLSNLLDKSFKYLAAAFLVIIPLYPKFPFIKIPGIYVSIRLEDFLVAIIGVFALVKIVPRLKMIFRDEVLRGIIIFLIVGAASLASGVFLTKTVEPSLGLLHFVRRVEYFVPFFAVAVFFTNLKGKSLEFYIKILMLVIFAAFLYGIGERYFKFPVIITQNDEYSKGIALSWTPGTQLNSTFAGHYDLATFLVLTLPMLISLFFLYKDRLTKITLLAVIFSGLWLLASTASRVSIVAYLFAASLSLLLVRKFKAVPVVIVVSLIFFGASSNVLARYTRIFEVTYKRIMNIKVINYVPKFTAYAQGVNQTVLPEKKAQSSPTPVPILVFEDRSTSIRLNVEWPRAIRAFLKNPLFGTGYSSIGLATDNDYLRLLGEVGFLGFSAFILIIVRILAVFAKVLPLKSLPIVEQGFISGIIGGTFGILLNGVFIDVFEASKVALVFWLLFALAVYTVKSIIYEQKNYS